MNCERVLAILLCLPLLASAAGCTTSSGPGQLQAARDKIDLHSFESGLRPTVVPAGEVVPQWTLTERMKHYHVPGVAIAIIRDGKVVFARGYGTRDTATGQPVNAKTLFSVGSISKVVTAAITLRRVAQGKVDLDAGVDQYLAAWHIPKNPKFPRADVTLRMLMSHTSGLNVHGFMDFPPDKPVPTLLQTLNGTGPAMTAPVHLIYEPGSRMHYSGGGVEVEQLAIENLTGLSLEAAADKLVFQPLGMKRSSFASPLPAATPNVAHAYNNDGKSVALPRGWQTFAGAGASGLWSSVSDLGKFVAALINSYRGNGNFLPQPVARDMMTEVSPSVFGLGVGLGGAGRTRFFYKGGANNNYRAWIEGHLDTGSGLVILTNGTNGNKLYWEIRNAVADMLSWKVGGPVRTVILEPETRKQLEDFAGVYHIDQTLPMALRRGLVDAPETVQVYIKGGHVYNRVGGSKKGFKILQVTPTKFVLPSSHTWGGSPFVVVFHRDGNGKVNSFTLKSRYDGHAYYTRQHVKSKSGSYEKPQ